MQQPAFGFQLFKEWRARIRRQDMKGRALQTVFLDPARSLFEHIRAILVKAQNKAAVHLDSILMKDSHPARIVIRPRCFLPRRLKVAVGERLESNKDTGAAR